MMCRYFIHNITWIITIHLCDDIYLIGYFYQSGTNKATTKISFNTGRYYIMIGLAIRTT